MFTTIKYKFNYNIIMNTIYFEISGYCNAKCKYCCNGNGSMNDCDKRFIPVDDFTTAIAYLKGNEFLNDDTVIHLYNWGEPFLHPQFDDIIQVLINNAIKHGLSTNGSIYKELIDTPLLHELKFSLPGYSQESHNKIHKLDFQTVISNIDRHMTLIPHHKINITYFIYPFNIHEIELIKSKYQHINFNLPYYNDYNSSVKFMEGNLMPWDMFVDHVREINKMAPNDICPLITTSTVIDEYCNVLQCCGLPKNIRHYNIGNLFDLTINDIQDRRLECQECIKCKSLNLPNYWLKSNDHVVKFIK